MRTRVSRFADVPAFWVAMLLATLLMAGCTSSAVLPTRTIEPLIEFKQLARNATCTDTRNRLFLVDERFILWDTAGNCADASYALSFYNRNSSQPLCTLKDSVAGPVNQCTDSSYQKMFDTISTNLDKADLGLGAGHSVRTVPF
jgi:hypothetical protein